MRNANKETMAPKFHLWIQCLQNLPLPQALDKFVLIIVNCVEVYGPGRLKSVASEGKDGIFHSGVVWQSRHGGSLLGGFIGGPSAFLDFLDRETQFKHAERR